MVIALLGWPGGALAAITVNTTADLAPSGSECLGVPGDCSVRRAIDKAATVDTINVPEGMYLLSGTALPVTKSLTINGAGARTTTVSGNNISGAFIVSGSGVAVSISGMTITAGHLVAPSFLSGGAIDTEADSLTLDRVSISGTTQESTGSAVARGAGINVRNNSVATLTITNSAISGNVQRATGTGGNQGAGLFASGVAGVTITNSTIARNSQETPGGGSSTGAGIYAIGGVVTLKDATISGNSGSKNVENNSTGTFNVKNTIIANGASGNCSGTFTSQGHNLESADECGFHGAGDQVNKDPLLGPLADNGGPTDTEALLAGSPAIDAGDANDCPPADQRGISRPQQSACDIGAFEFQPPTPDKTAAALSELKFAPASFAPLSSGESVIAGRRKKTQRGSQVSYKLSEDAKVAFTVERKVKGRKKGKKCVAKRKKHGKAGKRCTTYKSVKGSFSQSGKSGANGFRFSGRVNGKKLKRGSYRLVATATDAAGNRGVAVRTSFRIVK